MSDNFILSLDNTVGRNAAVIEAEIDGEIVAMNIETGFCYGLNLVGSRIWNLLADPVYIYRLCEQLCAEFEVDPDICERQVLDLLEELRAENLVQILPSK